MKRANLRTVIAFAACVTLFTVVVGLIAVAVAVDQAFSDSCENTVWKRASNPVSRHTAFLFERGCGATTGFSTHVSIVDGDTLPDDGGNVFVIGGKWTNMAVTWQDANNLVISNVPRDTETFHRVDVFEGVQIHYRGEGAFGQ